MKFLLGILAFSFITNIGYGKDYKAHFDQYFQEGDTSRQIEILRQWEQDDPENPELFTSYFNYYFRISRKEILSLSTKQPRGESLSLVDSAGKIAGFLGSDFYYDYDLIDKAFNKIDQGIQLYPNRLDMRFGKIFVLGQLEHWDRFTDEIINAIHFSEENNNQWIWTYNEEKGDGEAFFLSAIQEYQTTLYMTGDDDLLANMKKIAEEILKLHPNNVENLSNLSVTYMLNGDYDKAIEIMLRAEAIDPEDGIILSNIAYAHKLKGDIDNSIKYYEKMLNLDDLDARQFARQQIEQMKE